VTVESWIATGIAIPAVGALIYIARAYVSSTQARENQLVNNDERQGEITKAFVDHVAIQTKTLGEIALGVARHGELIGQVTEAMQAQTEAAKAQTEATKRQTECSTEEHREQWKVISGLCEAVGRNGKEKV
jgi:hypothetical protein